MKEAPSCGENCENYNNGKGSIICNSCNYPKLRGYRKKREKIRELKEETRGKK